MLLIKGTLAKYPFIFVADALYILKLRMTQNITRFINEEEKMMLETAALFISICHAPWFIKFYIVHGYQSPLK
jgi:hypothetical protein